MLIEKISLKLYWMYWKIRFPKINPPRTSWCRDSPQTEWGEARASKYLYRATDWGGRGVETCLWLWSRDAVWSSHGNYRSHCSHRTPTPDTPTYYHCVFSKNMMIDDIIPLYHSLFTNITRNIYHCICKTKHVVSNSNRPFSPEEWIIRMKKLRVV